MYSKDQRRIAHCLVVLDILMKNCGIVFVNNVALYMHLLRNFFDRGVRYDEPVVPHLMLLHTTRQDFDERNTLLATGMIAGWQTMQIDMSVELQNKALDPISKLEQMFNALVRANYPFPEGAFDKIPAARMEKLKADGNKLKFSMLRTEVTVIGNGRELHLREHGTKPLFSLQSLVPK
ncbi:hypothetical protein BC830DRAFT_1114979 [Chytriomyces sp. MP71]|nr:hypothetical protein BC830DRAFT_1114979 [Chytriomyces sp. MP71]